MEIRPYQSGDLESITALMSELGYPVVKDQMNIRMENMEAALIYHTFVAVQEEQVAVMIGCRDILSYENDGFATQISAWVTKKELQGQGIGSALVEFVEKWALERGANALLLTSGSSPERKRAHEFYEKLGYAKTGFRFVKTS